MHGHIPDARNKDGEEIDFTTERLHLTSDRFTWTNGVVATKLSMDMFEKRREEPKAKGKVTELKFYTHFSFLGRRGDYFLYRVFHKVAPLYLLLERFLGKIWVLAGFVQTISKVKKDFVSQGRRLAT